MDELTEFEMTEEQATRMIVMLKVPSIATHSKQDPMQARARVVNEAWQWLGKELGFDWKTVEPMGRNKMKFKARKTDV